MVCAPVRRDNPRAKARGLSLRTGAQTMLYLSLVKGVRLHRHDFPPFLQKGTSFLRSYFPP